jgi:hypothetical protein
MLALASMRVINLRNAPLQIASFSKVFRRFSPLFGSPTTSGSPTFFEGEKMKFGKWVVLGSLGVAAIFSQAAHAGDQDFSLVNKTGVVITHVLVSPHEEKSWGEDIMGKDVLGDDEKVDIKFHRSEDAEYWDLKIVDKDGHEIVWENLNLLKISKVTLKYDESKATAEVE